MNSFPLGGEAMVPFTDSRATCWADDMILVRLGTSNPCRTPEEQSQWTEGLRAVLRDLRQNHANNLDVVATEIANYRRRFVNDASKILNI